MKRPKVFTGDGVHPEMTIEIASALEEIALGEADLGEATAAIAKAISCLQAMECTRK